MDSPPPSGPSPSVWQVALPYLVAVVTAVLGWFAALSTSIVQVQGNVNVAFRTLMDEWQTERARLIARISELEANNLQYRATINQGLAREAALERRIARMLEDRE